MKKVVSIILTALMLCSFAVMAFADETGVEKGMYQADVTGTYVEGTVGNGIVYCVDISWSDMSFTYHSEKAPVWNVTDHTYSEAVPAYWEGSGSITVTNHSNVSIGVTPDYASEADYSDAKMVFDMNKLLLDSAANGNEEKVGSIEVTPSGFLPANTEAQKIGSIEITVADSGIEDKTKDDLYDEHQHKYASFEAMVTVQGSALDSDAVSAAQSALIAAEKILSDKTSDIVDARAAFIEASNAWERVYAQFAVLEG